MRNYIKAEFYRSFNRMYFWMATAICAGVGILANLILLYPKTQWGQLITLSEVLPMSLLAISVPLYLIVIFCDMISIEEFKHLTTKNVIGHGLSRTKMYLGKMIVTTLLAVLSASIILGVFLVSGWLLLGVGEGDFTTTLINFSKCIIGAVPLWISGIALLNLITFILEKEVVSTLAYLGAIAVIPTVFEILGTFVSPLFMSIHEWLPTTWLSQLSDVGYKAMDVSTGLVATSVLVGMIYTVIFVLIGIFYTKRKTFK